jgi:arabinoxylan arabinofuranohydrolase
MRYRRSGLLIVMLCGVSCPAVAENPVIQTLYTADPAPFVHEGRLYLYTTHDEDVTIDDFFTMNDWRVYSTKDVVNWTDHGSPLHYQDFTWAGGNAWAGQVIHRNGSFYFYVPMVRPNGSNAIGVAVSDSPTGPFTDAIGSPLITSDCGDIDPTVFIDDDEQAYLYWGNPNLCYVKLNQDMISYQGNVEHVTMTTTSFGVRTDTDRPVAYEEGPWFYKRADVYYLVYPGGPLPEHIAYSTSTNATGPWSYQDVIMPAEGTSFTNHPGVVDFGGKSLFFYHNGALPGGGGFKRSVCVEEFTYGNDGSIPQLRMTKDGATAVASLNPFEQVEAETIAWNSGVATETCNEGGIKVSSIDAGDYIKLKDVEFGDGATGFALRVAATADSSGLELRLDATDGTLIGSCAITSTGAADTWSTQMCEVEGALGKHDLFLVFTGSGFALNWWKFTGPGAPSNETGESTQETGGATTSRGDSTTSRGDSTTSSQATVSSTISGSSSADTAQGESNETGPLQTSATTNSSSIGATASTQPINSSNVSTSHTTGGATAAMGDTGSTSATPPVTAARSGCGCRIGLRRSAAAPWALVGALAVVGLRRKRNRSRRTSKQQRH